MLLTGYFIETTDGVIVEETLTEIRERMGQRATAAYQQLLEHEIEMMVDSIALGQVPRPDIPILEAAENLLLTRTRFASVNQLPTPYNFNASAHIFIYEGKTYLRLNAENNIYQKTLKGIDGLFTCHVSDKEGMVNNGELWQAIMKKYSGLTPARYVQLVEWQKPEIDYSALSFRKNTVRSKYQARYSLQNKVVNMLGNNEQIPGNRLMEIIDQAMECVTKGEGFRAEMKQLERQLNATLPTITLEMIKQDPRERIACEAETAGEDKEAVS